VLPPRSVLAWSWSCAHAATEEALNGTVLRNLTYFPMFSSLVEGVRHVRVPLTIGLLLLLAVWSWFADNLEGPHEDGSAAELLRAGYDGLGSGGQMAIISFIALLMGGLIEHAVDGGSWFRQVVRERTGPSPDASETE
jgi:hypothetical protein